MPQPPLLLHFFSTFVGGGPQLRMAKTLNYLGSEFRHAIVPLDGNSGASYQLDPKLDCRILQPPESHSLLQPWKLSRLIRQLRPDLVVTYNWGAIDAVIGTRLSRRCPVVHLEHGFGPDEATGLKQRRVLTRRVVLRTTHKTVVPSRVLWNIARNEYRLPQEKIQYIANGVDLDRFSPGKDRGCRTELCGANPESVLFGFVGLLREEKNLSMMIHAFAAARLPAAKLVLVGEGPCHTELQGLVTALGVGDSVEFAGLARDTVPFYRAFDVFLMSSLTEQMPMSLLEAMGCGLPVLATNVGDTASMLGASGAPEVVLPDDQEGYTRALEILARDAGLRASVGDKNRERCIREHDAKRMFESYAKVFRDALPSSR